MLMAEKPNHQVRLCIMQFHGIVMDISHRCAQQGGTKGTPVWSERALGVTIVLGCSIVLPSKVSKRPPESLLTHDRRRR